MVAKHLRPVPPTVCSSCKPHFDREHATQKAEQIRARAAERAMHAAQEIADDLTDDLDEQREKNGRLLVRAVDAEKTCAQLRAEVAKLQAAVAAETTTAQAKRLAAAQAEAAATIVAVTNKYKRELEQAVGERDHLRALQAYFEDSQGTVKSLQRALQKAEKVSWREALRAQQAENEAAHATRKTRFAEEALERMRAKELATDPAGVREAWRQSQEEIKELRARLAKRLVSAEPTRVGDRQRLIRAQAEIGEKVQEILALKRSVTWLHKRVECAEDAVVTARTRPQPFPTVTHAKWIYSLLHAMGDHPSWERLEHQMRAAGCPL